MPPAPASAKREPNASQDGKQRQLTFPALPFAKLAPRAFLTAHLTNNPTSPRRPSGRSPLQPRIPAVHTGSLTNAHGSAVVRTGDTAVVCGIRGEIMKVEDIPNWETIKPRIDELGLSIEPYHHSKHEEDVRSIEDISPGQKRSRKESERDIIAQLGLLVPNVDLQTGCSPSNTPPFGPPTAQAQAFSHRMLTLLSSTGVVALSGLTLWDFVEDRDMKVNDGEGTNKMPRILKGFWVLYIDIVFSSLDGGVRGAGFDTAWLAMMIALEDVILPLPWFHPEIGVPMVDQRVGFFPRRPERDPEEWDNLRGNLWYPLFPLKIRTTLSFGVFEEDGSGIVGKDKKKWILLDLDGFEDGLCHETGTVALGQGGEILRVEKGGGGGIGVEELKQVVAEAVKWRKECIEIHGLRNLLD